MAWFSSTVMTPSLPTTSMALEMISPIFSSPLALMVATWATCSRVLMLMDRACNVSTILATAPSIPRLRAIGLWPASTRRKPDE